MKGDVRVIEHLNAQLKNELTAINQYFVHYRLLKHWGFDKLSKKEYEESIGEMKHADALMERIFMLDGLPNLQDLGKLLIGENVPEVLACDLKSETGAQATIKDGMAHCEAVRDYVSRDLLQGILDDTEEHIDFLETQIELIDKVGVQMKDGSDSKKTDLVMRHTPRRVRSRTKLAVRPTQIRDHVQEVWQNLATRRLT